MAKITRHQGVSHARADELAAAAAEVDAPESEAEPKRSRRRGRHEAPEASA